MKTILTAAQSAKLIELGIDPKLASAGEVVGDLYIGDIRFIPIFAFADIFPILPKEIWVDKFYHRLVFDWSYGEWYVCYQGNGRMMGDHHAPEFIDAIYNLLIWAIENKFVKTNKDN